MQEAGGGKGGICCLCHSGLSLALPSVRLLLLDCTDSLDMIALIIELLEEMSWVMQIGV